MPGKQTRIRDFPGGVDRVRERYGTETERTGGREKEANRISERGRRRYIYRGVKKGAGGRNEKGGKEGTIREWPMFVDGWKRIKAAGCPLRDLHRESFCP